MAADIRPLQWSEPALLDRAGSGSKFWWSKPDSFHDRDVYGHSATVVNGRVWVLGGKNQPGKRISVHSFDPVSLVWSDQSPHDRAAPTKRWGHSVCKMPGRWLLVVGGFDSKHNLRDSWAYSTEEGTFTELCDDLVVFGAYHSVVFEQKSSRAVLFGGQCCVNGPYEYFQEVHSLQFQDDEVEGWALLPISGSKPCPRAQHSAAIGGSAMVIYGGANNVRQFHDVWHLDLVSHTWTELCPDRLSAPPPPVETQIEEQYFRVKSCRSILALRGMQLLILGQSEKSSKGRWGLYSFDLRTLCWKAVPVAQTAIWRGNAAGWITKLDDGTEELWIHGGHMEPGSHEFRQRVLPLFTGPSALLHRTIRGINALPPENLKLVFGYLSGHVLDLL